MSSTPAVVETEEALSQRARNKAAITRRILAAAREAFVENGLSDADLVRIARRANVGRATLYRYFDGRTALLRALMQEDWDKQAAIFASLVEQPVIDADVITRWLRRLLRATAARATSFPIFHALGDELGLDQLLVQRERLMAILARRFSGFAVAPDGDRGSRVGGLLLLFQIEQFATHAAVAGDAGEIEQGIEALARQLLALLPDEAVRKSAGSAPHSA